MKTWADKYKDSLAASANRDELKAALRDWVVNGVPADDDPYLELAVEVQREIREEKTKNKAKSGPNVGLESV